MNEKRLLETIKTVVDMRTPRKPLHANDESQLANELNNLYQKFDAGDHTQKTKQALDSAETDFCDTADFSVDQKHVC